MHYNIPVSRILKLIMSLRVAKRRGNLILFTLTFSLGLIFMPLAFAGYPSTKINFKNISVDKKKRQFFENKWLRFISDHPEALVSPGKKYKDDQECKFNFELDSEGQIDINSLKLLREEKQEINFAYNLKAIEFLKQVPITLTQNNSFKSNQIELVYFAF